MKIRFTSICAAAAAAAAIAAVPFGAIAAEPADHPNDAPRAIAGASVGRIVSIEPIRTRPKGSGVGAVAGGVVGGVLGHEVFGGTAATAIGAVGGAVAGNNLERNHREGVAGYTVSVRLNNGGSRSFSQTQVGGLHVGDRVRVQGGRIHRI
ncbi:MAG: glycine zipper 2TM domain-containing protein [Caldimonas sp.]